jgi:hypothetical protein
MGFAADLAAVEIFGAIETDKTLVWEKVPFFFL